MFVASICEPCLVSSMGCVLMVTLAPLALPGIPPHLWQGSRHFQMEAPFLGMGLTFYESVVSLSIKFNASLPHLILQTGQIVGLRFCGWAYVLFLPLETFPGYRKMGGSGCVSVVMKFS